MTKEQTAKVGKIMTDKTAVAWSRAEAIIAAAQRMAFPIEYLVVIRFVG